MEIREKRNLEKSVICKNTKWKNDKLAGGEKWKNRNL